MTDDQQAIDRIERDRRRREREFLLLLLLLSGDSRRRAVYAVKIGYADPVAAARVPWLGSDDLEHDGAAPVIAEQMAHAELEGARRAYLLAGSRPPTVDEATFDALAASHAAEARSIAQMTWAVIEEELHEALLNAAGRGIDTAVAAIRQAFGRAGVTRDNPATLEKGVERQVVGKYNAGLWKGYRAEPGGNLVAFTHRSVLDRGTTAICRERDGLTLAKDHPYWLTNWPDLHWGCRSCVIGVFNRFTPSTKLPTTPPSPGFGRAPGPDLGSYFGLTQ